MGRVKEMQLRLEEDQKEKEIKEQIKEAISESLNKRYADGYRAGLIFQSCALMLLYFIITLLNNYIGG